MDPAPALVRVDGRDFRAAPPAIEVVNPIGSGDCLLAGLVDGWIAGLNGEELVRRGLACGAANAEVWDAGAITPEAVARLEPEVAVEPAEGRTAGPARTSRLSRIVKR